MLKKRAMQAGLDLALFSGHSMRAGFLTSAAEAGADVLKMSEVSRHKSLDVLRRYVRRSNLFKATQARGSCEGGSTMQLSRACLAALAAAFLGRGVSAFSQNLSPDQMENLRKHLSPDQMETFRKQFQYGRNLVAACRYTVQHRLGGQRPSSPECDGWRWSGRAGPERQRQDRR
jgi:hypothetical protein